MSEKDSSYSCNPNKSTGPYKRTVESGGYYVGFFIIKNYCLLIFFENFPKK